MVIFHITQLLHDDVVMANCLEPVIINLLSDAELIHSPPMGLNPVCYPYIRGLANQYGGRHTLGNYSFRPSTSSSLIVLSQIHCSGERFKANSNLLSNHPARQ